MENRNIAYIGGGVIVILLGLAIFGFISNSKNKKNFIAEQQQTESLRSEKQMVMEELDSMKNEYGSLSTRNDSINKMLAESEERSSQGNRRISALTRENKALNQVRVELEELQKSKAELDNTYAALQTEHEKVLAANQDLQSSLSATETQRNDITGKYEKTELYNADNFLVTATRGKKDKIVACASRAKKLNMSFEVPQNLNDSVTYIIETPSGNSLKPQAIYGFPYSRYLTAGLNAFHEVQNPRQITLTYVPEEKLEKGEYRIRFISNGITIGNCRLQLK